MNKRIKKKQYKQRLLLDYFINEVLPITWEAEPSCIYYSPLCDLVDVMNNINYSDPLYQHLEPLYRNAFDEILIRGEAIVNQYKGQFDLRFEDSINEGDFILTYDGVTPSYDSFSIKNGSYATQLKHLRHLESTLYQISTVLWKSLDPIVHKLDVDVNQLLNKTSLDNGK